MIVFKNEGEMPIEALNTFGLSVKETDNPIGRFGTGLKYAIATIVRGGGSVRINSGLRRIEIVTEEREIRGQIAEFVLGRPESEPAFELGFTSDLGRDWQPWAAFRELWCNALDEGGDCRSTDVDPLPQPGWTTVQVDWPAMDRAFENRDDFVIDPARSQPLEVIDNVEVHRGSTRFVFHRGIRIHELKKPISHRINILRWVDLTEDRQAKYGFVIEEIIASTLARATKQEILDTTVTARGTEEDLKFHECDVLSDEFVESVRRVESERPGLVTPNATLAAASAPASGGGDLIPEEATEGVKACLARLRELGVEIKSTIIFAGDSQNDPVVFSNGRIFLGSSALRDEHSTYMALLVGWALSSDRWAPVKPVASALARVARKGEERAD